MLHKKLVDVILLLNTINGTLMVVLQMDPS